MSLFKDKFQEMEKNKDIPGLIQLLKDSRWQNRYKAILSLINIKDESAVEDVRVALGDEKNPIVTEIAVQYLRSNNAFPEISPEDVDIYSFDVKNSYIPLENISVISKESKDSDLYKDDLNLKLKEKAAKLGANAVINVKYSGIKASGMAVIIKTIGLTVEKVDYVSIGILLATPILWITMILIIIPTEYRSYDTYILIPFLLFSIYLLKNKGHRNRVFKIVFLSLTVYSGIIWAWFVINSGFSMQIDFLLITALFLMMVIGFVYDYKKEIAYYSG